MNNQNINLATEFRSSGKTQRAFCAERGISIDTLRYYLYKKDRRGISLRPGMKKTDTLPAAPAFLSFNHDQFTEKTSHRHHCTIIQGYFSIADIADLLSGAVRP